MATKWEVVENSRMLLQLVTSRFLSTYFFTTRSFHFPTVGTVTILIVDYVVDDWINFGLIIMCYIIGKQTLLESETGV